MTAAHTDTAPTALTITADGGHEAIITRTGAMLSSYRVAGRDAVVPFEPGTVPPAFNGAVLAPWPNRVRDGRYTWDGTTYQVDINDLTRHNALHGLVFAEPWTVVSQSDDAVSLGLDVPVQPGWPFRLHLVTTYSVGTDGLVIEVIAQNTGEEALPYGVGFHPWLATGGADIDDCTIQVDGDTHIVVDDRLLPVGSEPVEGTPYDLRTPTSLAGLDLDDAWEDATFDADGRSWGRFGCPDGRTVAVWMEAPLVCWQVCSGDHVAALTRVGLAVEPMTCVAEAFNTGDHLIVLAPGETHAVRWGIQVV